MMKRNASVVAVVLLLSTSSGCSGMKNFLFGRGAQCGLCNKFGAPAASLPYGPALAETECSCGEHVAGEVCTNGGDCNSYGAAYAPDGGYSNSYGPVVSDPYSGQIIGGGVMSDGGIVYESGAMGPGTMSDNFGSRVERDSRGDIITGQDALPPGASPVP